MLVSGLKGWGGRGHSDREHNCVLMLWLVAVVLSSPFSPSSPASNATDFLVFFFFIAVGSNAGASCRWLEFDL